MTISMKPVDLPLSFSEDILLRIFLFVNDPILLTHVCRIWRLFAISSPLLWTQISVDHCHDRRDAFLTRSQLSPLSVFSTFPIHSACERCSGGLTAILQHLPRICELVLITSSASNIWPVLLEHFSSREASVLKTLVLKSLNREEFPLTPLILDNGYRMLRDLDIANVNVQIAPLVSHNLTALRVVSLDPTFLGIHRNGLSLMDIVGVLQACCRLCTLSLKGGHWNREAITAALHSAPKADIHLPCLQRFDLLTASSSICKFFAETIQSSHRINWIIDSAMEVWSNDFEELRAILSGNARGERLNQALHVDLSAEKLQLWISPLPSDDNLKESGQIFLTLKRVFPRTQFNFMHAVDKVLEVVNIVSNVLHMKIAISKDMLSPDREFGQVLDWRSLFEHLPMLAKFHLHLPDSFSARGNKEKIIDELCMGLVTYLAKMFSPAHSDERTCPHLSSLQIDNSSCLSTDSLLQCFQIRNMHRMRLRVLALIGDYADGVTTRWMDEAKAVVDEVYIRDLRDAKK